MGQATYCKDLVWTERGVVSSRDMILINHIIEHVPGWVPKLMLKRGFRLICEGAQGAGKTRTYSKAINPEGLYLYGFSHARRKDRIPNLGIHPGKLNSPKTAGQESITLATDTESGPLLIARNDRKNSVYE
jgi:hypothetical protein